MAHHHHQLLENQSHPAVDCLLNLFTKATHDLTVVYNKLEREFHSIYPDNANPMKLLSRIKKIEDDLTFLKEHCRELLAAKQDLIDQARTVLVGNRSLLQRLQASSGLPVIDDSDDSAYINFSQIIDEWTTQVRSGTEDEKQESGSEDVNQKLFSAMFQGN